jgi:hypothetical protein
MAGKNFHAATSFQYSKWIPQFFTTPYTDSDYDIFEDIWANTLVGSCIDILTEFVIGLGFRPVFKLRDDRQYTDPDAKLKELQKYNKYLDEMIKIDRKSKINIIENTADSFRNREVFGRSVLAFDPDGVRIPSALKPLHPRDLGRVFVRNSDWGLSSVYAFQKTELIKAEDMIYFCNMRNSPIRRSMWYGYSSIQRVVGQARSLREIYEFDGPEIAKSLWAGYGLIIVDNDGLTAAEKKTDLETIKQGLKPAAFNLINGKKDEINYIKMDTDPRIQELIEMARQYERAIIGNYGVPGPLLGREEESNMATLFGKIRLFLNGPVQSKRREISRDLATQWYTMLMRNIEPSVLDEVELSVEFEPIILEEWMDNIDALLKLRKLVPELPSEEILRLAGLEELKDKLTPDKPMSKEALDEITKVTENNDLKSKLESMTPMMK